MKDLTNIPGVKATDITVYRTTEYGLFKKLQGNRGVDQSRIKKTIDSINAIGWVTQPIVINELWEIIDGQGRYEALKELQKPIEFVVAEGLGLEECVTMNINQTNWKPIDYIYSYQEQGKMPYILLRKLLEEFPEATLNVIATAVWRTDSISHRDVKQGTLRLTSDQYMKAHSRLSFATKIYTDLQGVEVPGSKDRVVQAVCYYYDVKGIDLKNLREKIKTRLVFGKPWTNIPSCLQAVEDAYNYMRREKLYLFTEIRKEKENTARKLGKNAETGHFIKGNCTI